jgi:hypothetical protein
MQNKFFSQTSALAAVSHAILVFCLMGCSVENLKPSKSDANKSELSKSIPLETVKVAPFEITPISSSPKLLDSLFKKHLNEIIPKISKAIPQPIKFDYPRLENSFLKMLIENKSDDSIKKYQFICDENERWIYRCNMETGEIECFSMSSNKLRLLSSIK